MSEPSGNDPKNSDADDDTRSSSMLALDAPNLAIQPKRDGEATRQNTAMTDASMIDASVVTNSGSPGIPPTRPTRDSVMKRLSEALMRRSLTKIDLSQRGLLSSDARLVKLALNKNASLSVLKLGYNNLQDEGVVTLAPGISAHKALTSLDLGFNNMGDTGCKAIAYAMLDSSSRLDGSVVDNGTLQTLYLAGNLIGEEGALALADVIRRGCRLRKLHLTGNRLGPDGVKALTEAISEDERRRCNLLNEQKQETSNGDQKMSNGFFSPAPQTETAHDSGGMQELFLGGTSMGPQGCLAVSHLLECSASLRVISLANCGIGDNELGILSESIKSNRDTLPLESLQLSFNDITWKGLEKLMNAVWGSQTLCELRLDNNNIGYRGAQQVAAVLPSVKNLKVLDIGFNLIKSDGMRTLMKMVAETQHLVSLSISGNPIDTIAAKAVAYGLAYNRSLKSLFLDHCSIGHEGQRHIAAGVVSNSHIVLRKLTGFRIGPPIVTIGLPSALEHWSNEQVLNFIHLMWEQTKQDEQGASEEGELDPLHFLPNASGDTSGKKGASSGPLDPTVVVEVAKRAFTSLGENGHDVFSRNQGLPVEPSFESPLAEDAIMVESGERTEIAEQATSTTQTHVPHVSTYTSATGYETIAEQSPPNPVRSFVAPPPARTEPIAPDPSRKRRIVEWLCKHIGSLNELAQLPFNSAELWRLHQHYFTPIVNESGGPVCAPGVSADGVARIVSSVPEVSRGHEAYAVTPSTQSYEEHAAVPLSDPSLTASPPVSSLPMLKRKVSYRFLGEAALSANGWSEPRQHHTGDTSVSRLIEDGTVGHSMPPKTKRARRNKSRISFLPRIKAKLDSYLDVCHEKALIILRQLHYVERALLRGEINPCDPAQSPRTHLTGVLASEAEMILIDMM